MSTPTGRPPPSPRVNFGNVTSLRVGDSKHTIMHQAAERGNLEEMQKAAAHDPSSVGSKGHMGVSIFLHVCVCLRWGGGREQRGNDRFDDPIHPLRVQQRTPLMCAARWGQLQAIEVSTQTHTYSYCCYVSFFFCPSLVFHHSPLRH